MNILVITTRNIYGNSGEYSLMSAKDKALKRNGINLIYYSFRRKFDAAIPKELNVIKQDNTFNLLYKKRGIINNISSIIEKYDIDTIILSGGWIFILHQELKALKKKYNLKFSFDYQGAIEEIVEYNIVKNSKILSSILYRALKKYEHIVINMVDLIEVVSENCIKHIEKTYNTDKKIKKVIVHCGIENPISYNKYEEYRQKYREYYKLEDSDIACVYVGGIAPWQNVHEIIEKANENQNIKLFFFTSQKNQEVLINKYTISSNIIFGFLPQKELQKVLCGFDYGFLLRNEDITNYVAFPNKYSDYINARLQVVVKSNNIGCYPLNLERQKLIHNISYSLLKKKLDNQEVYNKYIEELTYDKMVENLIQSYKDMAK
jgi:hypothetical protein